MEDIILITIILITVIVLTIIIYIILSRLVKEINNKVRSSYLLKLQYYEKEIKKSHKKPINIKLNKDYDKNSDNDDEKNIIIMKDADYKVDGLLKEAKKIDEKFNIDNVKTIKSFIKNNVKDASMIIYKDLIDFKNKLNKLDESYLVQNYSKDKILAITPKRLKNIIEDEFIGTEEMTLMDLLEKLDLEIKKYDPVIYVLVGNKNLSYNYIDKRINTMYDEDIYKGIKIYYHNKMYDYSVE